MNAQPNINWGMRKTLVSWMVGVHWKLKLLPETLFLSVNILDRYLSLEIVILIFIYFFQKKKKIILR